MALAAEMNVKIVPRGGGTSLLAAPFRSVTAFARDGQVQFRARARLRQPLRACTAGRHQSRDHESCRAHGLLLRSRSSSQIACSIGGDVRGELRWSVHSLKYGLTTNNILGLEIVLMGGEVLRLGGKHLDSELYDLMGLMTGSEGLLGVITEVTVRILQKAQTARGILLGFPTVEAGADCVAKIIAAGIIPGGLEMMDSMAIVASEDFEPCGYPREAGSLLICELDGTQSEVDHLIERVLAIARDGGATFLKVSESEAERLRFWAGRKNSFPAVGAIGPDYLCMDGTIPRNQLGFVLAKMQEMSQRHGLRVANVFHAGDGNLHPLILYDSNKPGDTEKAEEFGADILKLCVEVGGVLTGEHGVGVEKRDLMHTMFNEVDLAQQQRVKCAFDPNHRLNPGKVFPTLQRCAELGRMHVHRGNLPFPNIPRF